MRALVVVMLLTGSAAAAESLDGLIEREWRKEHVKPAPPVDDARFLRRIYLDLTGTVPPPAVVTAYLADQTPDKAARAVDALLASPRYADHFTDYWDKILLGRRVQSPYVDRAAFREWLHEQLAKNAGWNDVARELIGGIGQNSHGAPRSPNKQMDPAKEAAAARDDAPLNPAVNFILKYNRNPIDLAGKYAKVFLGVHIQCAQCHDHPTEKWKQDDFRQMAAAFVTSGAQQIDMGKTVGVRRVQLIDVEKPVVSGPKGSDLRAIAMAAPRALDGTALDPAKRRHALADWTVDAKNPWFARAVVNRYWAYFLGRGFVEPIDDFRRSNLVVMPAVLDALTADFASHGFDLKRLIRTICAMRVYHLSADGRDGRLWADYQLRPMGPEELLEAVSSATNLESIVRPVGGGTREALPIQLSQLLTFLFDVDEEEGADDSAGTIPQALMLINGTLVNLGVSARPGSALAEVMAMPVADEQKIAALYVRTLSRPPTAAETKRWMAFLAAPRDVVREQQKALSFTRPVGRAMRLGGYDPLEKIAARMKPYEATAREQAYEDMFWTLLNSSEFLFHH